MALAAIASVTLLACPDDTVVVDANSNLTTDVEALDFGNVYVGAERRLTLLLGAPGDLPVDYRTFLVGDTFGYQAGPASGLIPANGGVEMVVVFRPGRPGLARAQLVFQSNATEISTRTVELTAQGILPPDCEDGNGCTVDTFDLDKGTCVHEAQSFACDDFDLCTTNDTCTNAVCLGQGLDCDDDNPCTDDFCDPQQGCVHRLTQTCDDNNPCTADTCDAQGGCQNNVLDDGTPCDDGEQCTTADICLRGTCIGVNVPEGTECDDHNPCSKDEQCTSGECIDETYREPGVGDVRFVSPVGTIAPGAAENPIIDRDSSIYVGTRVGVTALDRCGDQLWENTTLGTPRWSGAVSLPGQISVPVGSLVVDLDTVTGAERGRVRLGPLFNIATSSTGTTSVRVIDMAARASGALVVSAVHRAANGEYKGLIAEIDRTHSVASLFRPLGSLHASRLAVDRDEAIVAVLATGDPDDTPRFERLARFGLDNAPGTSWSSSATIAAGSEISIDRTSRVLWTPGLLAVTRDGRFEELVRPAPGTEVVSAGAALALGDRIVWVAPRDSAGLPGPSVAPPSGYDLVASSTSGATIWVAPLSASAEGMSPTADITGNIFVLTFDGRLNGFGSDGRTLFTTALSIDPEQMTPTAVAISFASDIVIIGPDRVVAVRGLAPMSGAAWPRHRRDNLSTGHR